MESVIGSHIWWGRGRSSLINGILCINSFLHMMELSRQVHCPGEFGGHWILILGEHFTVYCITKSSQHTQMQMLVNCVRGQRCLVQLWLKMTLNIPSVLLCTSCAFSNNGKEVDFLCGDCCLVSGRVSHRPMFHYLLHFLRCLQEVTFLCHLK